MDWVIDSGASFHVTPHRSWFHDYDASSTDSWHWKYSVGYAKLYYVCLAACASCAGSCKKLD
ncbi:hypothetical protein GOP47_0022050 [Adiantum capillus-veneris]|uniref:Retrovirus-related Pol polyprotein from transposon TNT 1-94-like beta-barrel domain-containing protein n=1 Tax=Adiantum capillus-veneris TaxID=13818 RepID=A0A9D4Z5T0_ADICA|nr:hypothetical protein GOP47_0022050 [Adiantum capillus-veneris]